ADVCMVAAGSLQHSPLADIFRSLGHTITPLAPSLFAFNIADRELCALAGISVSHARVRLDDKSMEQTGPLLITHKGISGPAVLKLSAWGARVLAERQYQFCILVDWLGNDPQTKSAWLRDRQQYARKKVVNQAPG